MKQRIYVNPRPMTPDLLQAKILHVWEHDLKLSELHNAVRAYPGRLAKAIAVDGRYFEKEHIPNVVWDRMDNAPNGNAP